MPQTKRNLLLTKTAIGVYVSLCATILAISPNIENLISRGKSDTDKANIRDGIAIVVSAIGAVSTLIGRYDAGGVYTPKYIPGEDPDSPLQ
jgi:hypothetical protein